MLKKIIHNTENRTIHTDITKSIVESSSGWAHAADYGDIQFYEAVLAIDTPKFKKGDKISCVTIMYSTGMVQLYQPIGQVSNGFNPTQVVDEFPIKLSLV